MSRQSACRRHGVNSATFYKWKAKRLKALGRKNARLKRMADAMLDNVALKNLMGKGGSARQASEGFGVSAVGP